MTYRNLGRSGLKLSRIGLGSWMTYGSSVDREGTVRCVHAGLEAGIQFIDTADIYAVGEAERLLGEVLREVRRADLVIATKAFWPMSENVNDRGLSRKHLFESLHGSLRRLQTDYVDLYQCHRFDPETPVEEVVRAMDDLIRAGKALYWGVSMWGAEQIEDAVRTARALGAHPPISSQPCYNMLEREVESEVVPACERLGLSQVVFSPLCEGLLTGKYTSTAPSLGTRAAHERFGRFLRPRMTEENVRRVQALGGLAREVGRPLSQLALAWVLRLPNVTSAIIGATRPEQVVENAAAATLELGPEVLSRVEAILGNAPRAAVA
jgi:voltage-dependent potassium channel beta subunit